MRGKNRRLKRKSRICRRIALALTVALLVGQSHAFVLAEEGANDVPPTEISDENGLSVEAEGDIDGTGEEGNNGGETGDGSETEEGGKTEGGEEGGGEGSGETDPDTPTPETTYNVTIKVQIDGTERTDHNRSFRLLADDGSSKELDAVTATGTYEVVEVRGDNEIKTGVSVTVEDADATATATVDYYTVTFEDAT